MKLLLASSSTYRQALLSRLRLPFDSYSPNVNESRHLNENAEDLVSRLSLQKALSAQSVYPEHIILASDQVAYVRIGDGQKGEDSHPEILTKPHTIENAIEQLSKCSGQTVRFITGLCCLSPKHNQPDNTLDWVDVTFRDLSLQEITAYIEAESPLDCAGSFKAEGLGVTLFDKIESSDPTTIVGLSLIAVNKALLRIGVNPLLHKIQ
ncbi:septum formation protein Maf [Glaciecola sp. MH2013]|uniref:Maf family protein n=1 Tax=Glaciecola sp. MH2013 TaxID=2785524 RepID=UPI00189CC177|nr:nucleoside triphosphate pyrophosphatase [Glaciecola sp. MH2013]MBF7072919.1 septum formation protein Maf [Glaciecola sp. MH2013]